MILYSEIAPTAPLSNDEMTHTINIKSTLEFLAKGNKVQILYAAESGSRVWGLADETSDFDIRFIYKRPIEAYLTLNPQRDVIEHMSEDKLYDYSGWDIFKALKLYYKSNVAINEWLTSNWTYWNEPEFVNPLKTLSEKYFSPKAATYHYINHAENTYLKYLKPNRAVFNWKKYLYPIRSILACYFIKAHKKPAPLSFSALYDIADEHLSPDIIPHIDRLLDMKHEGNLNKTRYIPFKEIDEFICVEIRETRIYLSEQPKTPKPSYQELNELLIKTLKINT